MNEEKNQLQQQLTELQQTVDDLQRDADRMKNAQTSEEQQLSTVVSERDRLQARLTEAKTQSCLEQAALDARLKEADAEKSSLVARLDTLQTDFQVSSKRISCSWLWGAKAHVLARN